jgi:hypothetical protein
MPANQASQVQRAVLEGDNEVTHTYISDKSRNFQYSHENNLLTGRMLEEYKKFKPVFENSHLFTSTLGNPLTGFGLGRFKNNMWNKRYKNRNYNSANPPSGTFFLKREEAD